MQGCLSRMADEVFDGDEARASALFGRQPVLLAQSHRLRPLVRLLVEELKATLAEVCVMALFMVCVGPYIRKCFLHPFGRCYTIPVPSNGSHACVVHHQPPRVPGRNSLV